jgi:hypothetical protein
MTPKKNLDLYNSLGVDVMLSKLGDKRFRKQYYW